MDSKVQSILSYLGLLWLVAYFVGKDQRDELSRFHLKQGFGLLLVGFVFSLILSILMAVAPSLAFIFNILGLFILILIVIGIIHAANQVKKPLPIIGAFFVDKFKFID